MLDPETEYNLMFNGEMNTSNGGKSEWKFLTPLNKTLLLRTKERVTLYNTQQPPIIEMLGYNIPKKTRTLSVCPVDLEKYGKIEIFLKNHDVARATSIKSSQDLISKTLTPQEEFFYSGLDSLFEKN
jgi:hypothetical protein